MLSDLADMKKGEISISYTPERGSEMFARGYPLFHKKYPEITFPAIEARSVKLEQLLVQGTVSLVLTAQWQEHPRFDYFHLDEKRMAWALPKHHPLASTHG